MEPDKTPPLAKDIILPKFPFLDSDVAAGNTSAWASSPMPLKTPRLEFRFRDFQNPEVDCEFRAGQEWFYKLMLLSYPMQASAMPPLGTFQKLEMEAWDNFFTKRPDLAGVWSDLRDRKISPTYFAALIEGVFPASVCDRVA